jgi:hypothetical protein
MRRVSSETIRRMRRRVLTALALTFVIVFGLGQNAYADVIAEGSGVRGRGDWSWGVHELRNVYLGVRDLACDSNPVYVNLRVHFRDGTFTDTLRRDHHGGCGTAGDWYNLYVSFGPTISGVQVRACVNRNFNSDLCYFSTKHDNPTT